jgi:hypothetical protein
VQGYGVAGLPVSEMRIAARDGFELAATSGW